jgi:hypothetical protein
LTVLAVRAIQNSLFAIEDRWGSQEMSHRKLLLASPIAAAVAALVVPITALAAAYSDNVAGVEVYATSTEGVFTGTAGGSLPGVWSAVVLHTPLGGTPQQATITGGSFELGTSSNGFALVTGAFTGGKVLQTGGSTGCSNQTYTVNGTLSNVGAYGHTHTGAGVFLAILTHYRHSVFGTCVTYGASINGTVNLSF